MDFIYSIDNAVVDFMVGIQNSFLSFIFNIFTVISEKGLIWIAIGIILVAFRKTRKIGICYAISLAVGFSLSELVIKDLVCRERPFIQNEALKLLISAPDGHSFPSSHSASSFASAVALFLHNRKYGAIALVGAFMIAFSRLYFTVHYFTDVLCGTVLGTAVAITVYIIYRKIEKRTEQA